MSLPPYSPGTVIPSRPISPSLGHRSWGKALSWSMASARGAISASAKRRTASRSASMSSPSGNLRMHVLLVLSSSGLAVLQKTTGRAGPVVHHALRSSLRAAADAALETRGGAAQRQLQLAHHRDALLGHAVGGLVGRDVVAVGDLVDARQVVVDRAHHAHRALAVVAGDLQRHVHHAAGVDRVVGRVEDAAVLQLVADRVAGQLVVRRTAHDLELEARQRLLVDRAAQRAG